ncbi:hypothetical protein NMY22_g17455 [Coprinellus aureogranulatus]|nr:hypothetical protein NMY22_g17455 [Coprinellus aureogranulatus]
MFSESFPIFEPRSLLERLGIQLRDLAASARPRTRSGWSALRRRFVEELRAEDSSPEMATTVVEWVSRGLGVDEECVNVEDALEGFADIVWSFQVGDVVGLSSIWHRLRHQVIDGMLGTKATQSQQHNILLSLTEGPDEYLEDDYDSDGEEEDVLMEELSWEGFEVQYNMLFGRGVKPSQWVGVVKSNQHLWEPSAVSLDTELNSDNSDEMYELVVGVLRRIRLIPSTVFRTSYWTDVVKQSGLASRIVFWSYSGGLCLWKASFAVDLLRCHRIDLTLLCVLYTWTPSHELKSLSALKGSAAERIDLTLCKEHGADQKLSSGASLLRAIRNNPDIVPFDASPSCVFFLLGTDNLREACVNWLFPGLHRLGFDTTDLCHRNTSQLKEAVFDNIMTSVSQNLTNPEYTQHPLLKIVFRRTVEFWELKKEMKARRTALEKKAKKKMKKALKKARKAMKKADKEVSGYGEVLAGGETLARGAERDHGETPKRAQEVPMEIEEKKGLLGIPGRTEKPGEEPTTPKSVYSPEQLGLKQIRCDESVVLRCGVQIFRLVDKKTGVLVSMSYLILEASSQRPPPVQRRLLWACGALPEDLHQKMLAHVKSFAQLKGLQRGAQFRHYSRGNMVALGPRMPQGGIRGDSFRYPTTMSAADKGSLHCLFDHAEDSLILDELARLIAPEVHTPLHAAGRGDERLGLDTGGVLYYCENYAAPLHLDQDAVPGLCANLGYRADPGDYCFINLGYRDAETLERFYFEPRTNSFWSFEGKIFMEPLSLSFDRRPK